MMRTSVLLAASAAALLAAPLHAQNVILDEGSFTIYRNGQEVGTETFTIRRVGTGAEADVIANAVVRLDLPTGSREMRPLLRAGADMALSAYQIEVSGDETTTIAITSTDRRFVARVTSEAGEREREFRATPETILLDEDVAHQYYFVGPDRGGAVPVIVPRSGSQARLDVRNAGTETLDIGGTTVSTRKVVLGGGDATREVWFDSQGRVVRVDVPSSGYRAVRTSL